MLGYCTTLDGDAVQYVLSHGLPEWSREHMAGLARCGGASATSETTDGRGEGHGSVELHVHSSDRGGDAGASPAYPMATVHSGVDLSAKPLHESLELTRVDNSHCIHECELTQGA